MNHVLDTTAMSALMKGEPGHTRALLALHPAEVTLPQPALAEIWYGLYRLGASKRRRLLEQRLDLLLASIARCEWTDSVSRCFGELKAKLERGGERIDDVDAMIAAHALALEATIVTANGRHFSRIVGLQVTDWTAP